ncbi:MAG TPA: hypothetical protein VM450_10990 [Thermomicrobiales bacterium]|nr:hypothetical protein [Thermomicrobiales bacterium]
MIIVGFIDQHPSPLNLFPESGLRQAANRHKIHIASEQCFQPVCQANIPACNIIVIGTKIEQEIEVARLGVERVRDGGTEDPQRPDAVGPALGSNRILLLLDDVGNHANPLAIKLVGRIPAPG